MSLKHAIYMTEMKKRFEAKEKEVAKKKGKAPTPQNAVKTRRHRLPR